MYHIFNNIQANWLLIRVSKSDNVDYVKIVSLAKGAKMERSWLPIYSSKPQTATKKKEEEDYSHREFKNRTSNKPLKRLKDVFYTV